MKEKHDYEKGRGLVATLSFAIFYMTTLIGIMAGKGDEFDRDEPPKYERKYEYVAGETGEKKYAEWRRVGVSNTPLRTGPAYVYPVKRHLKYYEPIAVLGDHNLTAQWDLRRTSRPAGDWEQVKAGEEYGWIFYRHSMSFYGGPDRKLEWDTKKADKILEHLSANRYLRLESWRGINSHKAAKLLTDPIEEAMEYRDMRASRYVEQILLSNVKEADPVNTLVSDAALRYLGTLANPSSLASIHKALNECSGWDQKSVRGSIVETMLTIVEKNRSDFGGYAAMAAREVLSDHGYSEKCKDLSSKILSVLGKKEIP